eukprot:NODE_7548_length_766_cov_26.130638_g6936_i0.p1 GENE.NODE_7548_length_766_cov_26.130638_g6936_i0~~NODE_7548_length_766_cov_26.130638_g6936_i0.p1  ORF type:complete len:217 (+),score=57.24 NODE_7548_length_766_cov_26.130638_g6936_i0:57-707(+)
MSRFRTLNLLRNIGTCPTRRYLSTSSQPDLHSIHDIYSTRGTTNYEEAITQLEHALQCGYVASKETNGDPRMVVAAMLHDIGHLVVDECIGSSHYLKEDMVHEEAGARWLSKYFGKGITEPVRLHVMAKRYLARDPTYWSSLSDVSKATLDLQGGPYSDEEAQAFMKLPFAEDAVRLRTWDEKAKVSGLKTPDLGYFIENYLEKAAKLVPPTNTLV